MLIDRYEPEDVFARMPEAAAQTDLAFKELDLLLEDDQMYQQVRADLGMRSCIPCCLTTGRLVSKTYGHAIKISQQSLSYTYDASPFDRGQRTWYAKHASNPTEFRVL